ncbi:hypothetical protein TNCV_4339681 [Trichonephila clavipes]|nr:hypothetical protein TNCV_4339681 [Trichonephila clavipes]
MPHKFHKVCSTYRNRFQWPCSIFWFATLRLSSVKLRTTCGIPVVKVSDHDRHVMSSSPVPLKTHRVGQRCMLNLLTSHTSSRWYGVAVRREGASLGVIHFT